MPEALQRADKNDTADVLVVIVSWNSGPWLSDCLQALAAQSCRPRHTLIWDNGSDAATLAVLDTLPQRFAGVQVHRSGRNHGFAAGNNLAVAAAPASRSMPTARGVTHCQTSTQGCPTIRTCAPCGPRATASATRGSFDPGTR